MQLITVTAASTNDWEPDSAPPMLMWRMDVYPSTRDITFTGLKAGFDGQQIYIRNSGLTAAAPSVFNITFSIESSSSIAANRFSGAGSAFTLLPGGRVLLVYYTRTARWSVS